MAKKRARTERREAERAGVKLAEARIKLARLEVGGSEARPIEVTSASVIEVHAASLPCASCGAMGVRVDEHIALFSFSHAGTAESLEDSLPRPPHAAHAQIAGLRVTKLVCQRCGYRRDLFFRIGTPLLS